MTAIHQKSHKKLHTINSVGNATADVAADIYTEKGMDNETEEIPLEYNANRYMYKDTRNEEWLRGPIRRRFRKLKQKELNNKWGRDGRKQDRLKDKIGVEEFLPMLRTFRKKHKNDHKVQHLAALTRLVTGVHNTKPHYEGRFGLSNDCQYCKYKHGKQVENDEVHEASCKANEEKHNKVVERCILWALGEAELYDKGKTKWGWDKEEGKKTGVRRLLNKVNLVRREGRVSMVHGGEETGAPSQESLERMTTEYLRYHQGKRGPVRENRYRAEVFKAIRAGNEEKRDKQEVTEDTWEMIQKVMGCDTQWGIKAANRSRSFQKFFSSKEEQQFGSNEPSKANRSTGIAAEVQGEKLAEHLRELEGMFKEGILEGSAVIIKASKNGRRTLGELGYKKIAAEERTGPDLNIYVKQAAERRKEQTEVLKGTQALEEWGKTGFRKTSPGEYIKETAREPWPEEETESRWHNTVVGAMGWIHGHDADRGVATKQMQQYMQDRGITKTSARRIVKTCTEWLFDDYVRDDNEKRAYYKKSEARERRKVRKRMEEERKRGQQTEEVEDGETEEEESETEEEQDEQEQERVTTQRRVEESLKESEKQLKRAVDILLNPIKHKGDEIDQMRKGERRKRRNHERQNQKERNREEQIRGRETRTEEEKQKAREEARRKMEEARIRKENERKEREGRQDKEDKPGHEPQVKVRDNKKEKKREQEKGQALRDTG